MKFARLSFTAVAAFAAVTFDASTARAADDESAVASSYIAFSYLPAAPMAGGALRFGQPIHNVGFEWSPATFKGFRYHLMVAYSAVGPYSGIRVAPLQFGYPRVVHANGDLRIEIEPLLSILEPSVYGTTAASLVTMSTGVEARVNLWYGRLYAGFTPLGFDFRYFGAFSNPAGSRTVGDGAADYRLHFLVGYRY